MGPDWAECSSRAGTVKYGGGGALDSRGPLGSAAHSVLREQSGEGEANRTGYPVRTSEEEWAWSLTAQEPGQNPQRQEVALLP